MKKTTIMFALMLGVACTASAQKTGKKKAQKSVKTEQVSTVSSDQEEKLTLTKEVYPQKEENSNLYHGLTKKLTFDRMIPPHGLEVTYDKTVHILFPASVKYVDLGSEDLIAGKADGAENVIRVKAAVKNFKKETNMSVITEDGSFYTFNVKYAKEPLMLNIEMADFIHDGEAVNRPNNAQEIYLKELGKESPMLVHLIMKSIHKENKRKVKHIGTNAAHISVKDGKYCIDQIFDGETVEEVLDYVQYNPKKLVRQLEQWVTKSVKEGKISLDEGKEFLGTYRNGLFGYTYLQ